MADALARQEYPAMLASLQPAQAITVLGDRVKRIGRVNNEIADWLLERRKVEELYIQGLKRLAHKQPPDNQSELGVFTTPWQKIVAATESIALSHQTFANRIEKDIEHPLRLFASQNQEMTALATMQLNLGQVAKDLAEAQERSDKLSKKGGKANSNKVDGANQKLESMNQQWDSQAPFVFEKLQAVDESRLNHLRDVLTQYQTHEADQVERSRVHAENTLNSMLEVDTAVEIINFSTNSTRGQPKVERRTRQDSSSGGSAIVAPAPVPMPTAASIEDNARPVSAKMDGPSESKGGLKRLGTMLGRRRKSVQGPSLKGFTSLSRNSSSRDDRPSPSPRSSSNNLRQTSSRDNYLSSVVESPLPVRPVTGGERSMSMNLPNGDVNGTDHATDAVTAIPTSSMANGSAPIDLSDVKPPPGPPPSHLNNALSRRDSEGYTVPAAVNDPITQAQLDAAEESEQQQFKLNIKNEPIHEVDADAQAALSNVANTLRTSSATTPTRKISTVRGRREVRNTMYIPAPEPMEIKSPDSSVISSPTMLSAAGRVPTFTPMSPSEMNASDTQSVHSARSLAGGSAAKHPEMHNPGLNSSIVETVSAIFEDGELKTGSVIGEIALLHGHDESDPFASSVTETIRLDNFSVLEAIAPNHAFIDEVSSERRGEYKVNMSNLAKTTVAFRYKVHIDESNLLRYCPLILKPVWRPQEDKLGVIIEYELNPTLDVPSITLNNLVIIASYQGARTAGCQTKPTGTHLKDKSIIYWRLGDVTLNSTAARVIARLVGVEGAEPQPGMIEARWEYQGTLMSSGLGMSMLVPSKGKEKDEADPFADESLAAASPEGEWVEIESLRKVVSGKYDAKQVTDTPTISAV